MTPQEKLEKVKQALERAQGDANRADQLAQALTGESHECKSSILTREALTLINELEQDLRGKEHIKDALKDILAMRESWFVNSKPKELLICLESIYKITKENLELIEPPKKEKISQLDDKYGKNHATQCDIDKQPTMKWREAHQMLHGLKSAKLGKGIVEIKEVDE